MAAQQQQRRQHEEEEEVEGRATEYRLVDLTERGLQHLDTVSLCPADTYTLILDKNQLTKLENVEKCKDLVQLSVASNRLVRMNGVAKLVNLRVLNLPHNSIGNVEGLKDLVQLEWLNLAGNNIKIMDPVNSCLLLRHLDLSDNNISLIGDVSKLTSLKTLLLHGNTITALRSASSHLASGLSILSLAENEIRDLNEVSYLGFLRELEQLSIMNNPCVMATPSLPGFDYRPYIVSWCLTLQILDGYIISQKESLKAEWLYSQGKGRSFRPSQHVQLVQYLASVCPLASTPALQSAEDAKLEKILNKQRLHQLELIEKFQNRGSRLQSGPTQDLSFQSEHNSTTHNYVAKEPVIQINSWVGTSGQDDDSYVLKRLSPLAGQTARCCQSELFLEDIQTDEDKLNCSLLSSESTFMPVATLLSPSSPSCDLGLPDDLLASENCVIAVSYLETQLNNEESDDQKHQRLGQKTEEREIHIGRAREQSKVGNDNQLFCVPNALLSDVSLTSSASSYPVSCPLTKSQISLANQGAMENEWNVAIKNDKSDQRGQSGFLETDVQVMHEMNEAATKIQALWRGFYIRNCHINTKEVRSEIRLRRMQEHIEYLTEEVLRWRKECEEERIQRLVQEEAVKFLWNQVRSLQEWKMSVTQRQTVFLDSDINELTPSLVQPISVHHSECQPQSLLLNNHASSICRQGTNLIDLMQEFPDSGFQSSDIANQYLKDSLNSCQSSSEGSNSTVVEASLEMAKKDNELLTEETEGSDSSHNVCSKESSNSEQDNSLIEQYLNSVQQLEAAEDGADCSVRTETGSRQDDQDSLCEISVEVSGETNAKSPRDTNTGRTEMYSQAEECIYGMLDSKEEQMKGQHQSKTE
ncbi:centrosomal protein of 97 kDa [Callorhinchus milii]|uniref:Centrosomal protein of 97 kDa n=1 Tax=Callorhinchus milii TaxID=7868 RepID=A0A4W3KIX9_CALMI|nr:centrosomal protein of 97 kDa [Callorhinchus milii]|eukprot:gi/632956442/ref/XP_007893960.1/ PREDICTED: centrosomal protein of 97 kDa [Callorhinchus milii]